MNHITIYNYNYNHELTISLAFYGSFGLQILENHPSGGLETSVPWWLVALALRNGETVRFNLNEIPD
jgi:hypothetical protein